MENINSTQMIQNLQDLSIPRQNITKSATVAMIVMFTIGVIAVLVVWWYKTNYEGIS